MAPLGQGTIGELGLGEITSASSTPSIATQMPWFVPLSEPVRFRPGLKPSEQQFAAMDTAVIPVSRMTPWFVPLSEPMVKTKPGLLAPLQQFEARPPQLRPNPKTFATMASIEKKDTFVGGVRIWLRIESAEIGVIEQSFTGSQIGIAVTPTVGGGGGQAPLTIVAPVSGSPIAPSTKARFSIREI